MEKFIFLLKGIVVPTITFLLIVNTEYTFIKKRTEGNPIQGKKSAWPAISNDKMAN